MTNCIWSDYIVLTIYMPSVKGKIMKNLKPLSRNSDQEMSTYKTIEDSSNIKKKLKSK
ncbi:hypothetical protein ES332_D03G174300v1 [Gossypium tomentosum]|uniref:Uncharacterized protein n=1 Tax=Gossypium tomentosum TaxID=34277 RepID=A0A5D2LPA3_GOSTO|nr:hypothetical protein ES332_D03G174300v1 [Gossypium tomentosum]